MGGLREGGNQQQQQGGRGGLWQRQARANLEGFKERVQGAVGRGEVPRRVGVRVLLLATADCGVEEGEVERGVLDGGGRCEGEERESPHVDSGWEGKDETSHTDKTYTLQVSDSDTLLVPRPLQIRRRPLPNLLA